jgi:hypothetical protein
MNVLSFQINKNLLEIIRSYVQFQVNNNFPTRDRYRAVINNGAITFLMETPETVNTNPVVPISIPTKSRAFKKFRSPRDYSIVQQKYRKYGLFKFRGEKLNTVHTSSNFGDSRYFLRMLSSPENEHNCQTICDIMYGHINGSGSIYYADEFTKVYPSKIVFKNYLMEYFHTTDGKIPFKNGKNGDYFYAINFNRNLFPEMVDPGNIQITLSPLSSSVNQLYNTGSNFYPHPTSDKIYTLIDDSEDTNDLNTLRKELKEYYYLVSGSLNDGIYGTKEDDAWGIFFPRKGIIVLDGAVLDQSCSLNTVTASIDGDNIRKFFMSISASFNTNASRQVTGSWYARASEEVKTQTYFCRLREYEFNYSNNYTYLSGSYGEFRHKQFMDSPITYVTSVGLYNDRNELIAVGKLPKPLLKKPNEEHVIQVRLRLN